MIKDAVVHLFRVWCWGGVVDLFKLMKREWQYVLPYISQFGQTLYSKWTLTPFRTEATCTLSIYTGFRVKWIWLRLFDKYSNATMQRKCRNAPIRNGIMRKPADVTIAPIKRPFLKVSIADPYRVPFHNKLILLHGLGYFVCAYMNNKNLKRMKFAQTTISSVLSDFNNLFLLHHFFCCGTKQHSLIAEPLQVLLMIRDFCPVWALLIRHF